MNFTPYPLAAGQLGNAKGTLYTIEAGFRAIIDHIVYFNTDSGALVCTLFVSDGTTSRQMQSKSVNASERQILIDTTAPLYLDEGYLVEGGTTSGSKVNYFIYGQLEQKG